LNIFCLQLSFKFSAKKNAIHLQTSSRNESIQKGKAKRIKVYFLELIILLFTIYRQEIQHLKETDPDTYIKKLYEKRNVKDYITSKNNL